MTKRDTNLVVHYGSHEPIIVLSGSVSAPSPHKHGVNLKDALCGVAKLANR
jgi:hypothetical protein